MGGTFKKYKKYNSDSSIGVNQEAVVLVDVADDGAFTDLTVFGVANSVRVEGDVSDDFYED